MANALYGLGKEKILSGAINLVTDTIANAVTTAPAICNAPPIIAPSCDHVACTVAKIDAPFACQKAAICPPIADTTAMTPLSAPLTSACNPLHAACALAMMLAPFAVQKLTI